MADGYARVSGSVGVATVHQGPGFTNTLTALTEAVRSRTPLLLLAAETAHGNQALDQVTVAESVGAVGMRLRGPADATAAFARARNERCDRRPEPAGRRRSADRADGRTAAAARRRLLHRFRIRRISIGSSGRSPRRSDR